MAYVNLAEKASAGKVGLAGSLAAAEVNRMKLASNRQFLNSTINQYIKEID
jgi:hypothetical protein